MRLVIDAQVWSDLDDIGRWIAKDRPLAARSVLSTILAAIADLQRFPRLARPGRARGTLERRVTGTPYIIVFELWKSPPAVVVVGIVHGARNR